MPAAATAISVNPKSAATIATIKKIIAHLSMSFLHEVGSTHMKKPLEHPFYGIFAPEKM